MLLHPVALNPLLKDSQTAETMGFRMVKSQDLVRYRVHDPRLGRGRGVLQSQELLRARLCSWGREWRGEKDFSCENR